MKQITPANDEATRKDLVNFILYKTGHLLDEETEHRFVAYLEKQKEQKEPFSCSHENGGNSEKPNTQWSEKLDIDALRDWSMRFSPDIRQEIEVTAYHFWNMALNARKEESK